MGQPLYAVAPNARGYTPFLPPRSKDPRDLADFYELTHNGVVAFSMEYVAGREGSSVKELREQYIMHAMMFGIPGEKLRPLGITPMEWNLLRMRICRSLKVPYDGPAPDDDTYA